MITMEAKRREINRNLKVFFDLTFKIRKKSRFHQLCSLQTLIVFVVFRIDSINVCTLKNLKKGLLLVS